MLLTANIFQPLIDVFEALIKFFHNSGGISWGWSIVLLTVAVRAVLVPLTFRQIKSMVRMQALAPQMKEIQAKYKQDKERQSQEMMKFYRENNVNPLGSCLPLVLQLPVFISLYYMLRKNLRTDICPAIQRAHNGGVLSNAHTVPCGTGPHAHASFLFIPDLTNKASGVVLVVLIILYVGSQLGSTLVMSSAATMDPMQRRMMLFLPLVFVLFVFRFPAGVLVYWITTNFWTMAQQYLVRKRVGPRIAVATGGDVDGTATASGGKPKGTRPRSGPSATKALPKASAETDKANGAKPATSGLASLFRGRAQPADQAEPATNGASNGSPSASDADSGPRAQSGARSGSGPRSGSGSRSGSRSRSASSKSSSGSGKASGSAKGSSSSGGSSKPEDGVKPPPPPRKRKKRSGRRR
ncbi:MAG: YidC/Oxa1 family membrane protein insertase [Solirubrobacteraceae bacterium]